MCEKSKSRVVKSYQVKYHGENVHESKKSFKCNICNKSGLYNHMHTVHDGKSPFKRHSCDSNLDVRGDMKRHVTSVHDGENSMKSHIESVHQDFILVHEGKKPYKCESLHNHEKKFVKTLKIGSLKTHWKRFV